MDGLSDLLMGSHQVEGKTYVVFGRNGSSFYFSRSYLPFDPQSMPIDLSLDYVNVASPDQSVNMLDTSLIVINVSHGRFVSLSAPGVELMSFYLRNISDGKIQFVSDGTGIEPQCRLVAQHPQILLSIRSDMKATRPTQAPTSAPTVVVSKGSSVVVTHGVVGGSIFGLGLWVFFL